MYVTLSFVFETRADCLLYSFCRRVFCGGSDQDCCNHAFFRISTCDVKETNATPFYRSSADTLFRQLIGLASMLLRPFRRSPRVTLSRLSALEFILWPKRIDSRADSRPSKRLRFRSRYGVSSPDHNAGMVKRRERSHLARRKPLSRIRLLRSSLD